MTIPQFARSVSLAAALLAPAASHAVTLPLTGTLHIEVHGFGAVMPSASVVHAGTVVVNGSGAGPHVDTLAMPANFFQANGAVQPNVMTDENPVGGIQLAVGNSAGSIVIGNGAFALNGSTKVCLFGPCSAAVANVFVPMAVAGVGGSQLIMAGVNLTVIGAPWTTGTVSIGTITEMGYAHGPNGLASSTGLASGQVLLVSPIYVSTNIPPLSLMPTFAFASLHFVPEPGTLLLIAAGFVGIGAAGRSRSMRHRSA